MEIVKLHVGTSVTLSNGAVQDNLREVEFVGEELARRTVYGYSPRSGQPTDTRGTTETLYRTEDKRMVVYVEDWTQWQGETSHYHLVEVSEKDLGIHGRFEALGREVGIPRPLTLDEVIGG